MDACSTKWVFHHQPRHTPFLGLILFLLLLMAPIGSYCGMCSPIGSDSCVCCSKLPFGCACESCYDSSVPQGTDTAVPITPPLQIHWKDTLHWVHKLRIDFPHKLPYLYGSGFEQGTDKAVPNGWPLRIHCTSKLQLHLQLLTHVVVLAQLIPPERLALVSTVMPLQM